MTDTSRAVLVVVLVVLAVLLLPALWMAVVMGGGMGPADLLPPRIGGKGPRHRRRTPRSIRGPP